MTVNQIMEITGKSRNTVLRHVKSRLPGKDIVNGAPLDLSEMETYMVLRSFHPGFDLEAPIGDDKVAFHSDKLPNGSQLHELRLLAERGTLEREHLLALLGLPSAVTVVEAQGDRRVVAIAKAILRKEERERRELVRLQGNLFPDDRKPS